MHVAWLAEDEARHGVPLAEEAIDTRERFAWHADSIAVHTPR